MCNCNNQAAKNNKYVTTVTTPNDTIGLSMIELTFSVSAKSKVVAMLFSFLQGVSTACYAEPY